ncbi:hypothetical protein PENANT_c007G05730 [Penicillium antarcticum]|uniref:Uncharacterized protein n=1 Tax=Penicillium antarcticum TaxID=416450 RepID=A0A1V6QCK0_9EURO|nr:uncharacterized protein N7508_003504 [Penicillium antarcticum]KAJ5312674.1 hypothetical protein N7508_003504 [Penicillium antarcticum]OQD86752.1 hypothetical protein PENANT_c007G05730 [Penicillium antarcticum]
MDHLPVELLRQISLNLKFDGSNSREDLKSFSKVSRMCYSIAIPMLYEDLTVLFWDPRSLRASCSWLAEDGLGRGRQFMKYARRLFIVCIPAPIDDLKTSRKELRWRWDSWKLRYPYYNKHPATRDTFLERDMTDPTLFLDLEVLPGADATSLDISSVGYCERDWTHLASLISRLHCVEQLEFLPQNEFPVTLMDSISQHHPNCKLNIWWPQSVAFNLPGLKPGVEHFARSVTDYFYGEYQYQQNCDMLRLQNLHTLAIELQQNPGVECEYLVELLPFLFQSPGLKHLVIQTSYEVPFDWVKLRDGLKAFDTLKREWQKVATSAPPVPVSSLESISIPGAGPGLRQTGPGEELLLKIMGVVDLSRLRSLQINSVRDSAKLARVATLLPSLERLFISAQPLVWVSDFESTDIHRQDMVDAIRAFHPLEYLHLSGICSAPSLMQIIQRHGPSLKGLIIAPSIRAGYSSLDVDGGYKYDYPLLNLSDIHELAESCPNLEELRLQVQRTKNRVKECEIYKALGNLTNLHSLMLDLHLDPQPRLDDEYNHSVLVEALVNSAIDKYLAHEIWDLVCSEQISCRLSNLRIIPFGHMSQIKSISRWFSRSFLVTRYNANDIGVPNVVEIGRREAVIRRTYAITTQDDYLPLDVRNALLDVWPGGMDSKWVNGWKSYPLVSS